MQYLVTVQSTYSHFRHNFKNTSLNSSFISLEYLLTNAFYSVSISKQINKSICKTKLENFKSFPKKEREHVKKIKK